MNRTIPKSYSSVKTHNTDRMALDRADSSVTKLCDLHVYKMPAELWRHNFNNVLNNVVTETISVGIIRVPVEQRLVDIRDEIVQQLSVHSDQLVPGEYVFLRSVGRSLTTLRVKQEHQLKAKHFVPPSAFAPELYILEVTPEVREALAISDTPSNSPTLSQRTSPSHRGYPAAYRNGYNEGDQDRRHNDAYSKDAYSRRDGHQLDSSSRQTRLSHMERVPTSEKESEQEKSGGHSDYLRTTDSLYKHPRRTGQAGRGVSTHHSSSGDEDTAMNWESTQQKHQRQSLERNQLIKDIHETKQARQDQGREREDLMKKAKQMQQKSNKYRNEARDMWKKKYFEEKKKTAPMEDNINMLQNELETLHRRQMIMLEGPKEKNLKLSDVGPSDKSNYVMRCARLQHEVEDLQRRVDHARMKLTAEMKLRVQAQTEMKVVRSEAMHKRLSLRAARTQHGSLGIQTAVK